MGIVSDIKKYVKKTMKDAVKSIERPVKQARNAVYDVQRQLERGMSGLTKNLTKVIDTKIGSITGFMGGAFNSLLQGFADMMKDGLKVITSNPIIKSIGKGFKTMIDLSSKAWTWIHEKGLKLIIKIRTIYVTAHKTIMVVKEWIVRNWEILVSVALVSIIVIVGVYAYSKYSSFRLTITERKYYRRRLQWME